MTKPKAPKTHFEQVPLEIVKKITGEDIQESEKGGSGVPVKPPAKPRGAFRVLNRRPLTAY